MRAAENCLKFFYKNLWNVVDLVALTLTLVITVHSILGRTNIDKYSLSTMAAVASSLIVAKIYDWLRLFEMTAFYVQLLEATIKGIGSFMLLFFVAMLLFGLPFSMLNENRTGESNIMDYTLYYWLFDVVYNQYLLSAGEFTYIDQYQ